jgi:hypothetical protein
MGHVSLLPTRSKINLQSEISRFKLDDDEDVSPLGEYHDDDSDDDDGPQVNSRLGKSFRMEVIDDY